MTSFSYASRTVLRLDGKDVASYLQGLITNDITLLETQPLLYTALLTPQGRYLFDFFIFKKAESYYCIVEALRQLEWVETLNRYKLRRDITILDMSDTLSVFVVMNNPTPPGDVFFHAPDPRTPLLGSLVITDKPLLLPLESEELYRKTRHLLGIAEGSEELTPQKSIILEYHFDALNALSWTKGCYMGQELMARTKHRGGLHKQCFGLQTTQEPVTATDPLLIQETKVGSVVYKDSLAGLALIRLEHVSLLTNANWLASTPTGGQVKLFPPDFYFSP